ncbi:hypothetical protein Taro_047477 [Colocasia esculenta]|uniref:Putative plant transposon protein domain-containing protein n=1 Tax=Colocasia esculenta TaxID=4460 RepID=A0A843X763_COLES|nr:hypothetical protein [Colocasia esculenta]
MAAPMISGSVGGYSAEYLSAEQQERFTFVKMKICGNMAVNVQNLEKNGMSSLVEALRRMQWMDVATFTEVSYPDLVKAFFVCLKSEADGSLVSSVKGIQIKVDHELLHTLFGVKTFGHSGVHTVNDEAKGLGIIGPGFRLKDGKLDINQMFAFNRLLHFIICQIMVPQSATFLSCTKVDSDMMFWVIQNKEINLAAVKLERMKFASAQIWDTKSKMNVSLPYAHLLTKIFKHFGVDLSGAIVEKMGQSIRSRNLKKSGFSVQNGMWTKTSVAEGEAIICDVEIPDVQEMAAVAPAAEHQPVAPAAEQQSVSPAVEEQAVAPAIEPEPLTASLVEEEVADKANDLPTSIIGSILRNLVESSLTTPVHSQSGEIEMEEAVAEGHIEESIPVEQSSAPVDPVEEEAPAQGEQMEVEEEAPAQGEQSIEEPAPQRKGKRIVHRKHKESHRKLLRADQQLFLGHQGLQLKSLGQQGLQLKHQGHQGHQTIPL